MKNDDYFKYPEEIEGYWPKPPERREARAKHRAQNSREIINSFKDCESLTITAAQYTHFSDRIRNFNNRDLLLGHELGVRKIHEENLEIAAIWKVFAEAKFSAHIQDLLDLDKFTNGMNKIGLLPHEAALMLAANDNKVSFVTLNTWLLKLPSTYNLTPTKQRYQDSLAWTRGFMWEFTQNPSQSRYIEPLEVFIAAQFQAQIHGITLDRTEWIG